MAKKIEDVIAGPNAELGPEKPPRRGRGTAKPKLTQAALRKEIESLLLLVNYGVIMMPGHLDDDPLTPEEMTALAEDLTAELWANPGVIVWIERYVGIVGSAVPHARLAITVMLIAIPRLVARDLIPAMTGMAFAVGLDNARNATRPMGARGAPSHRRGHGDGEDNTGGRAPGDAAVYHFDPFQSGQIIPPREEGTESERANGQSEYTIPIGPAV